MTPSLGSCRQVTACKERGWKLEGQLVGFCYALKSLVHAKKKWLLLKKVKKEQELHSNPESCMAEVHAKSRLGCLEDKLHPVLKSHLDESLVGNILLPIKPLSFLNTAVKQQPRPHHPPRAVFRTGTHNGTLHLPPVPTQQHKDCK